MGVHEKRPVLGSMVIPSASEAPSRLKVNVSAGMSGSVAEAVKVKVLPSSTDWLPIPFKIGAVLVSLHVIVNVSESVSEPSETVTVTL